MNLWPMLAHLEKSGVVLTTEGEGLRLRVKSEKPISAAMKKLLADHKADLLDLIVELEETAAILEINQGLSRQFARYEAGHCVRGRLDAPTSDEWLQELAKCHPSFVAASDVFGELQIVQVVRVAA